MIPSSPSATASTSGVSLTQITITSLCAARSAGLAVRFAPSAASSSMRLAVRFQTRTSNPAFNRFRAIPRPMMPRPMKPIRSLIGLFAIFLTTDATDVNGYAKTSVKISSIRCQIKGTARRRPRFAKPALFFKRRHGGHAPAHERVAVGEGDGDGVRDVAALLFKHRGHLLHHAVQSHLRQSI